MPSVSRAFAGNDPVERFLHRLSIFEPLDPDAREALRRAVFRGPLLGAYQETHNEISTDVSFLLTGWICHFRLLDNGRRQITSVSVPGDFTDLGFLTGNVTPAQSVATAPSQVGRIRLRQFSEIAEQFPGVMRASLRASATQAAISRERVMSLGLHTAHEKLAHLFCELWYRLSAIGLIGTDGSYDLPMTQAELGAALGLSTVHVNRTIQALRKGGAIAMQGGKVSIRDLKMLEILSGFDPNYLGVAVG